MAVTPPADGEDATETETETERAQERDAAGRFASQYDEADCMSAIAHAADATDGPALSERDYQRVRRASDPDAERVRAWAGSFETAVERMGVESVGNGYATEQHRNALQYTDALTTGPLSRTDHDRLRRDDQPSSAPIQKRLGDGSWNRAKFRAGLDEFAHVSGDHYPMCIQGAVRFVRDDQGRLRMYDVGSVEVVVTTRKQNSDVYHRPRMTSAFPDGEAPPEARPLCGSRMSPAYSFHRRDVLFDDMEFCSHCEQAERDNKQ